MLLSCVLHGQLLKQTREILNEFEMDILEKARESFPYAYLIPC
jgi:hypothetical protein